MSYKDRANKWYNRALKENDDFIKFLLLYIALEVLIKLRFQRIRNLKDDNDLKIFFFANTKKEVIEELKKELDSRPLKNEDPNGDQRWDGKFTDSKDFNSIIEYIIRARNNLFHGDKRPDEERDQFVIKYGNIFLEPIIKYFNKMK